MKIQTNRDIITSLPTPSIKYDQVALNKIKDIFQQKEIPNDYFTVKELQELFKQHKNTIIRKINLLKKENKVKMLFAPCRHNKYRFTNYYKFL
jgi:hypothetical protein